MPNDGTQNPPNPQNPPAGQPPTGQQPPASGANPPPDPNAQLNDRIFQGGMQEKERRTVNGLLTRAQATHGITLPSGLSYDQTLEAYESALAAKLAPSRGGKGGQNGNDGDPSTAQLAKERDEAIARSNEVEQRYQRTVLDGTITGLAAAAKVTDTDLARDGFKSAYQFKFAPDGTITVLQNGEPVRDQYRNLTVEEVFKTWIATKTTLHAPTTGAGRPAGDNGAGLPFNVAAYDPKNPPQPGSAEAKSLYEQFQAGTLGKS